MKHSTSPSVCREEILRIFGISGGLEAFVSVDMHMVFIPELALKQYLGFPTNIPR
jgi:hypothetical protein